MIACVCVCVCSHHRLVCVLPRPTLSSAVSPFVKPEISASVPACPLSGLQASLQTIPCELQDVKIAIHLAGRLSETHV